ncbi:hypothetical protein HAX54_015394 [Datura stramonium]|uniref:Uncharacterized protein n=1 Tax=Datura stramonium TaxID=4076 RepID=A0ABS8TS38_DATST|nr:hypothetical protein [Datura stramonium]
MERRFKENDIHHSKIIVSLATSVYFLKYHNFEDFCNYALKAIEIYPNQTAHSQIHTIAKPPEVAKKGENYCFGLFVLGTEGMSPFVRKNEDDFDWDEVIEIFDDETEDENGRKEESLGDEEKFVETNNREMNKRVTKIMKGLQKRLGKL